MLKCYCQQEAVGITVRGCDLKDASSVRLAAQMKISDFHASDGWLSRFRQRHGMFQRHAHGEAGSARQDAVGPFREELNRIINSEGLLLSLLPPPQSCQFHQDHLPSLQLLVYNSPFHHWTQRRTRNDYRVSCYYSIYIYL